MFAVLGHDRQHSSFQSSCQFQHPKNAIGASSERANKAGRPSSWSEVVTDTGPKTRSNINSVYVSDREGHIKITSLIIELYAVPRGRAPRTVQPGQYAHRAATWIAVLQSHTRDRDTAMQ